MRILSNFKDYYDYLSSPTDPVIYKRVISNNEMAHTVGLVDGVPFRTMLDARGTTALPRVAQDHINFAYPTKQRWRPSRAHYSSWKCGPQGNIRGSFSATFVVVGLTLITVLRFTTITEPELPQMATYTSLTALRTAHPHIEDDILEWAGRFLSVPTLQCDHEFLVSLNEPYGWLTGIVTNTWGDEDGRMRIQHLHTNFPLVRLGVPAILPATSAVQEIEWALTNYLTPNKCNPPIELTNEERLVQHGFDKKVSFRHRRER